MFFGVFILFLIAKNDSMDINREPGYFLSVLDSDLFSKELVDKQDPLYYSLTSQNVGNVLDSLDGQISPDKSLYDLLRIINTLLFVSNYGTMYNIFENSIDEICHL